MKKYYLSDMNGIYDSYIFKGLTETEIDLLLQDRYKEKYYSSGEFVINQNSIYERLLIIDQGMVRAEMINYSGESVVIEEIEAPRIIAPAFLFATENRIPVDVIAMKKTKIISVSKEKITEIMQLNSTVLKNFMKSMSDRSKFLSDKLRLQRFGDIKTKFSIFLLEQIKKNESMSFYITYTHKELADLFGVKRPSLSRVIIQMSRENIIFHKRNYYEIKNIQSLKDIVQKK